MSHSTVSIKVFLHILKRAIVCTSHRLAGAGQEELMKSNKM